MANNEDRTTKFDSLFFTKKNIREIKEKIKSGIDLEAQGSIGSAVLNMAVFYEMLLEVKNLLDEGANPNFKDTLGESILMNAVNTGNVLIIKELLIKVINIDEINNLGETAFIKAIAKGNTEVVKIFLQAGVNVEIKTMILDKNPHSIALYLGYLEIAKEIEKYSKNPIKYILENNHQAKDAVVALKYIEQHDFTKYSQEIAFVDIVLKPFEFFGFECFSVQGHFESIRKCLEAQPDEFVDDLSAICGENGSYYIDA